MKKISLRNIGPLVATVALICLPLVALAQTPANFRTSDGPTPATFPTSDQPPPSSYGAPAPASSGGTPTCNGKPCSVDNPLAVSNFCDLLKIVLQALLILGLPVAVIFLVLAGLQYITAYGDTKKIGDAHVNLQWTVIGTAIFLGAWTIAQIIKATLVSLGVSGFGSC